MCCEPKVVRISKASDCCCCEPGHVVRRFVSSREEAEKLASHINLDHIETSVKFDNNVNDTFELLARNIISWLF